jgi:peptide-O-fucosyltransferase
VNPGEGFNLRRDVYLRAANTVKRLRKKDPAWVLVLPAWPHLYHWQSEFRQEKIPWRQFFEVDKLNEYVPVMEFEDYLKEYGPNIQQLFYLQNFPWKNGDEWKERLAPDKCTKDIRYYQDEKGYWLGHFSGYNEVIVENLQCVSVLGDARLLDDFLLQKHDLVSVFIDRLESLLHVDFGQKEYWAARRSMVFAPHLKDEAEKFMRVNLPKPENDQVKGWKYMAVHLRRRDYVWYDRKDVPTLQGAIDQLKPLLKEQGLDALFVSSDAPEEGKTMLLCVSGVCPCLYLFP